MVDFAEHKRALLCNDPQSAADYCDAMAETTEAVAAWLQSDKMYTGDNIRELRSDIRSQPPLDGLGMRPALQRLIGLSLEKSLKVHRPHSLAHLHCPALVASQVAEVLINAANQSMDSWDQSPAGSLIEVQMIGRLRGKARYGAGSAGVFASGGTQSNLMGVLLACDACIAKHWKNSDGLPWSVQRDGFPADALQKAKTVCSENAHFSVQKNMAMMGMGFQSVVTVPADRNARMDVGALRRMLADLQAQGKIVAYIVATAGTTDAGAIDPLPEIRTAADTCGAWVHLDAARSGALLLSNEFRHMIDGIELTDSVTLDLHKHFFQGISCSTFLPKNEADYRFMYYEAEYLNPACDEEHGVSNLVSKSLQTTRRFDALKLWLTIEALGEKRYGSMIDHGIRLARQTARYIQAAEGLELLVEPWFASVLFCAKPQGYPDKFVDSLNQDIADELFIHGEANIGVTKVNGVQSLRMTLLSPVATFEDIQNLLSLMLAEAERIKDDIAAGVYVPPMDQGGV